MKMAFATSIKPEKPASNSQFVQVLCCLLLNSILRLEIKPSNLILNLIRFSKGLQTHQSAFIRVKGLRYSPWAVILNFMYQNFAPIYIRNPSYDLYVSMHSCNCYRYLYDVLDMSLKSFCEVIHQCL